MDEPDTDAILVVLSSNASTPALRMAEHLVSINEHLEKPLVIARIAAEYLATEALQLYRTHGIPVYSTPERAVAVVASMVAAGRTGRC
jgi:acyl-CoA synthetase (NDP forming)